MTDEKKLYKVVNKGTKNQIDEMLNYIYDKYKPLLIFVASKYLNNTDDIKDIVQDTFVEFFNNAHKEHKNIKAFLTIACKHNALDLIRKQKRLYFMSDEETDSIISDNIKSHDTYNEIIKDLNKHLTAEEVRVVLSHLIDGLSFNEISERENQNISTVKSIYYRALKKYKKLKGFE